MKLWGHQEKKMVKESGKLHERWFVTYVMKDETRAVYGWKKEGRKKE